MCVVFETKEVLIVEGQQLIRCCPPLQVPFMRNWFKDQCTTKFTVMLWFKRDPGNHDKVGLVHNGDCIDEATFLIYGNEGPSGKEVIGGLEVSPLAFTAAALVSARLFVPMWFPFVPSC